MMCPTLRQTIEGYPGICRVTLGPFLDSSMSQGEKRFAHRLAVQGESCNSVSDYENGSEGYFTSMNFR